MSDRDIAGIPPIYRPKGPKYSLPSPKSNKPK